MKVPRNKTPARPGAEVDRSRAAYIDQLRRERQRPELDWRKVLMSRPAGGTRVEIKAAP